jgi:hypothetical protein
VEHSNDEATQPVEWNVQKTDVMWRMNVAAGVTRGARRTSDIDWNAGKGTTPLRAAYVLLLPKITGENIATNP